MAISAPTRPDHCPSGSGIPVSPGRRGSAPGTCGPEAGSELPGPLVATEVCEFVQRLHAGIDTAVDLPAGESLQTFALAEINLVVLAIGSTLHHLERLGGFLAEQLLLFMTVGTPVSGVHHRSTGGEVLRQSLLGRVADRGVTRRQGCQECGSEGFGYRGGRGWVPWDRRKKLYSVC